MKRLIIIMMALLPFCSCEVRDAESSSDRMLEDYARYYMDRYVSLSYYDLMTVLLVTEYEEASPEEKENSKYDGIKDRIRHIDNETWYLYGTGTFKQNGSILITGNDGYYESNTESCTPVTITNLGDKWKMVHESENESMTVVFSKPSSGGEAWKVGLTAEKREGDLTVKFRTQEDGDFSILSSLDSNNFGIMERFGSFAMEIFRSGQMIDYCYLKYNGSTSTVQSSK